MFFLIFNNYFLILDLYCFLLNFCMFQKATTVVAALGTVLPIVMAAVLERAEIDVIVQLVALALLFLAVLVGQKCRQPDLFLPYLVVHACH